MYSTTILSTTTLNLGNAWHCLKLNSHGSHYETTLPKNHHPKKASRRVKAERRGLGFLALNRKILCNCYINFKRHFFKQRQERNIFKFVTVIDNSVLLRCIFAIMGHNPTSHFLCTRWSAGQNDYLNASHQLLFLQPQNFVYSLSDNSSWLNLNIKLERKKPKTSERLNTLTI